MDLVVFVCRCAIRFASLMTPRALRGEWRDEWVAEVRHGYAHLAAKGEPRGEICRKLVRFSMGAFPDAADLYYRRFDLRSFLGHPAFCLAVPLTLLGVLFVSTHGFRNCRQALAGLPCRRPEELVLLSRSARVMGIEAVPAATDYVDWQQRRVGGPMAGFVIDHSVLRVTPSFFDVLGTAPRMPFDFLGHTIQVVEPLESPSQRVGILARLKTTNHYRQADGTLTEIPLTNGSAVGVRFVQSRLREPLIFSTLSFVLVLGIGLMLVLGGPGNVYFFMLKTGLLEGVVVAAWAELEAGLPISWTGGYSLITAFLLPGLLLGASGVLLAASLRDHQRRCPVCWHRLAMPVRIGSRAGVIFDHLGEEVLCRRGHGALLIPERAFDKAQPAAWVAFDESWRDCFVSGGSK